MRLCDRVIVREWVQNKSHHHINESRTFSKGLTWCKLAITLIRRVLAERRNHLIFGHSPQTLTFGVVRMLYPRNIEHIGYQLRCDNNARTLNAYEREALKNWVHACWSKTPGSARKDMWPGRHTVTPNPDCEWHRVGQYQRNPPKWLSVLREVLSGILITEPNRRGSKIRQRRCPEMKRVPGRSWLTFRCHRHD